MGSVVISLDAELAWGHHDLYPLTDAQAERVSCARENWEFLVALFEQYDVPATWAVVGHLLLPDGEAERATHPGPEQWFETMLADRESNPTDWVGVDLVNAVAESSVDHEIASHSFSHPVFTEISPDFARAECRLAREVSDTHGFDSSSFVFPRNAVAHRDILAESGFDCYRGHRPSNLPSVPGLQGVAEVLGYLTGVPGQPLVEPTVDEYGLVDIPASTFIGGFKNEPFQSFGAVVEDPAVRIAKNGIDRACEEDGVLHLWLHPNDLTTDRYVERLRRIVSYLAKRRDETTLKIETMATIADRVRQQRAPTQTA